MKICVSWIHFSNVVLNIMVSCLIFTTMYPSLSIGTFKSSDAKVPIIKTQMDLNDNEWRISSKYPWGKFPFSDSSIQPEISSTFLNSNTFNRIDTISKQNLKIEQNKIVSERYPSIPPVYTIQAQPIMYQYNPLVQLQPINTHKFYHKHSTTPFSNDEEKWVSAVEFLGESINDAIGGPGFGIGTNGTGGLIGEFNDIINDVGKQIGNTIKLKLEFLQNIIDITGNLFLPILNKIDYKGIEFSEFVSSKFGPTYGYFTHHFHKCMLKSLQCYFLPLLSKICFVHCIIISIPEDTAVYVLVHFFINIFEKFLQLLCNPIKTFLHLTWTFYMKQLAPGTVYSLTNSMTQMGLNMEELITVEVEKQARILIPFTMTHILSPIRQTFEPIDFVFGTLEKGMKLLKIFNPTCWALDVKFAPKQFVELFDYKPRMVDTLMGSVILMSTLVKDLPGAQRTNAQEFSKMLDIMTGINCGVIFWTGTNGSAICEQRADIIKKQSKGV